MSQDNRLFSGTDSSSINQNQLQKMRHEIESIDPDKLLNTSLDDVAEYLSEKYKITVPELDIDNLTVDQQETQVDVSHDRRRFISDRSRPVYVAGTEVKIEIPFSGEAEVFKVRPNPFTFNPPQALVHSSKLIFSIVGTSLNTEGVRTEINDKVSQIQKALKTLKDNFKWLNSELHNEAYSALRARRDKILVDRNMVASLGFKMKEREGNPKTYAAPEIRRKISPVTPVANSKPFKPEPALAMDDYDHILGVMQNMALVMERSPSAFHDINEEALRSHFLVQLNGHYEGQATGETFNYEGKTDILIRSEGKNIFIAECKFWNGPKKLTETIDQLLGYASWRDTKTAIVLFNRNRDFSKVISTIPDIVRAHPQYKRGLPDSSETVFKYQFANRDDQNRELFLTVLAFDVPTP